ncbi:ATP-binding protein [Streptomyces sp. NPDC052000]|uniref:ATP-binding protein n=1 Tax=Streptomyces sp. NPDC052000 TaxID=3155676 RepID=UPI00344F7FED
MLGRDFRLSLTVRGGTLRIEVTDARADRVPVPQLRPSGAESGRGPLLVESLTDRWGVDVKQPAPCKTVWAESALPTASRLPRRG